MAVTLTINGQSTEARSGLSLFDQAESLGIDVPTSCRKQGKCKECMVEVVEGMSALSPLTEPERHLEGKLSPVVPDVRDGARAGTFAATPCGAGTCASSGRRSDCRSAIGDFKLDPAVTRDGDRILIDGVEVERSTGPIHGIAMDLGTTTVVLRLARSRKRRADRGHFV